MTLHAFLIEVDPSNSLGGSCLRDLWNTATYLHNRYDNIKIYVYTNSTLSKSKLENFPADCVYYVIDI